jgi:2-polyprenyl-3-methyl-5-hydroxy-6-metoxy-1,4-benzoquinol methylase
MNARSTQTTDNWNEHWTKLVTVSARNPAQAYRRKLVFEALALDAAAAPVRLLDLGSGSGDLAGEVLRARPDADVVGLDLSASGVEIAQRKVPKAKFFQQDFTQPIAIDEGYRGWATHAVCCEVLEHLDEPAMMLKNVRSLFAPGCRLVVTVPSGPMSAFDKHIGHRRHFTSRLLDETLSEAGLTVEQLRGAGFPFFNLYRLVTVARGKKLVDDAADANKSELPLSARAAIAIFSLLFQLNTSKTKLGWQLVAVGAEPR